MADQLERPNLNQKATRGRPRISIGVSRLSSEKSSQNSTVYHSKRLNEINKSSSSVMRQKNEAGTSSHQDITKDFVKRRPGRPPSKKTLQCKPTLGPRIRSRKRAAQFEDSDESSETFDVENPIPGPYKPLPISKKPRKTVPEADKSDEMSLYESQRQSAKVQKKGDKVVSENQYALQTSSSDSSLPSVSCLNHQEGFQNTSTPKKSSISSLSEEKSKTIPPGHIYGVIFPLIFNQKYSPVYQPVIVLLSVQNLKNLGCDPEGYEYSTKTFLVTLDSWELQCEILALGKTMQRLKISLKLAMETSQDCKLMRKAVIQLDHITILKTAPTLKYGQLPPRTVLSDEILNSLFSIETGRAKTPELTEVNLPSQKLSQDSNLPAQSKLINGKAENTLNVFDLNTENLEPRDALYVRAANALGACLSRRAFVPNWDTTGTVVRYLTELSECLFKLIKIDRDLEQEAKIHITATPDPTRTYKDMDRVFLEGVIELELSKYELAIGKARRGKPCSFVYSLVKHGFPRHYWVGVQLSDGLSENEVNVQCEKKSLAEVFGYANPFSEPGIGKFDRSLGDERIKAFIDHVHRLAGRPQYTEDERSKARTSLSKVLSQMNRVYQKNKTQSTLDSAFAEDISDQRYQSDNNYNFDLDETVNSSERSDPIGNINDLLEEAKKNEAELIDHVWPSEISG